MTFNFILLILTNDGVDDTDDNTRYIMLQFANENFSCNSFSELKNQFKYVINDASFSFIPDEYDENKMNIYLNIINYFNKTFRNYLDKNEIIDIEEKKYLKNLITFREIIDNSSGVYLLKKLKSL